VDKSDRRLSRITDSGVQMSFALLVVFAVVTGVFYNWIAAGIELALVVLAYFVYRSRAKRRSAEMRKYIEALAFQVDDASKHSIINFPLPMAVLRLDSGEIVWGNESFTMLSSAHEGLFEMHITDMIPGFDTRWIMEGKTICPYDVEMNGRKYNIYGNLVRSGPNRGGALLATLFWVDITEYAELRVQTDRSRPVVAVIVIDSYEELFKGKSEAEKSQLTAAIDQKITDWTKPAGGIVRRLERDRYLFVFENHSLLDFTADKFSILENMHQVQNSEGITATLSIGIGKGENAAFQELLSFASLAIDMALSRGGDQVVIKTRSAFEFYGGRSKEVEKRTKVKSRVMANALRQLIRDSSHVFIMGHRFSDLDCIGASCGLAAMVRSCGKKPYLITDTKLTSARDLIERIAALPQYEDCFVDEQEAMLQADPSSLCIVVDTSRPEIVEAPSLLQAVQRVAVVDHHRRAADYIENAAINMHETYASSASELVSELLQYTVTPQSVLKLEAEALLAGIFLDTKGFTIKTGVRTFEAAAYLKQLGADTVDVRKMFSGELDDYVKKYQIMAQAKQPFPGISLAVVDDQVERALASQAADELINISGVRAAFVVYGEGGGSCVSARSYGQLNVQMVMEKVGGGGSLTGAGAQFKDKTPDEVAQLLLDAIGEYLKEIEDEDKRHKEEQT